LVVTPSEGEVMDVERLFLICCGYEDTGKDFRLFLEGPNPQPSISRSRGVRTNLFYLFTDADAEAIRQWLVSRKAWQVLRVPTPYSKERGIAALRIAQSWSSGPASPLFQFASTRRIQDQEHRERLRVEVAALIGSVIENPVHPHELPDLQAVEDVINTAPVGVELSTFREVWTAEAGA
jgi:hypothetical protein